MSFEIKTEKELVAIIQNINENILQISKDIKKIMNNEELTLHAGDDFEEKEERDEYDDLAQDPDYQR